MLDQLWTDIFGPTEDAQEKALSESELARLKEAFDKFDEDESGVINLKEVPSVMRAIITDLGGTISEEEAADASEQLDSKDDGTCTFDEFKAFWESKSVYGVRENTSRRVEISQRWGHAARPAAASAGAIGVIGLFLVFLL